MKTISKAKAQLISSQWHGGQMSALYSFASSGFILSEKNNQYHNEVDIEINKDHNKKLQRELNSLKLFFNKFAPISQ